MKNTGSKRNVAEQVVDMMVSAGIKNVYAITGDSLNAVTDAISRDGRIRFIHMRNEEAGAFAASAEAQLTGHLACCAGSSGPGYIHLINGLYDAQRSDAPVLAIASTCASNVLGTGYFQETDPTLLFSDCSLYNQTAANPSQIPHMLQGAMQHAIGEGGVGVIGIPQDITTMEAVESDASDKPYYTVCLPQPKEEDLAAVVDMVNSASTIAVFAGHGASGAVAELVELSDLVGAPVVTTYKSKLELTGNMPNFVGHFAYLGMWSAIDAVKNADVTLIIGTNFPYPDFFPTDKKLIQIDVRAERLGKRAKLTTGICADSRSFLKALLPRINRKADRSFLDKALADYAWIKEKYSIPVDNPGKTGAIRPEYMIATLDRLADDNAIFTVDTGMNNLWTAHYLNPAKDRKMIGSFMHGSMANAMPQAIGAAVACPDRQVIAICGDGGLSMLMGELLTINQYRLPVKILVADNRSLAFVKWEMELAGYKPSETDLSNPDFAEMAKTIGFHAETVTDPAGLESAMKRWLSADGPALLSVKTDTDATSFSFSKEMMENAKPGDLLENFLVPGI